MTKHPNKKPFSQSIKMKQEYEVVNSLGLRGLFRKHVTAVIAGDTSRHCSTWFVVDKERFFSWTERRSDIYVYNYVVEIAVTDLDTCVRIHAVERTRKTLSYE
jgi:hypothetical protein